MALNIANPKVEQKAVRVSKLLNSSKTAAVETALDYFLEHHDTPRGAERVRQSVARILADLAALPVLDDRSADEVLGYDEHGLP